MGEEREDIVGTLLSTIMSIFAEGKIIDNLTNGLGDRDGPALGEACVDLQHADRAEEFSRQMSIIVAYVTGSMDKRLHHADHELGAQEHHQSSKRVCRPFPRAVCVT